MRTRITHPKATATATTTTTKAAAALAAGCVGLLLVLTGCDSSSAADPSPSAADAKNGDSAPVPAIPVPRGEGSRVPYDFNGDGHPDLVINDLVKAPEDPYGDDAGIGIVYGTEDSPWTRPPASC